MNGVHGNTDNSGGRKAFVINSHATWKNDARQMARYWSSAAECVLNACVEVGARVEFVPADDLGW